MIQSGIDVFFHPSPVSTSERKRKPIFERVTGCWSADFALVECILRDKFEL